MSHINNSKNLLNPVSKRDGVKEMKGTERNGRRERAMTKDDRIWKGRGGERDMAKKERGECLMNI